MAIVALMLMVGLAVIVVAVTGLFLDDGTGDTITTGSAVPATPSTAPGAEDAPSTTGESAGPMTGPAIVAPLAGSYVVEVVAVHPHDDAAYTQGLELHEGQLLQSNGLYDQSARLRLDVTTGEVIDEVALDDTHFGEGLTVVEDRVFQLTWKAGLVVVADIDTLEEQGTMRFEGEGWGICYDDSRLIMSDGSGQLTHRDPADFDVITAVDVIDGAGQSVERLNELECVGDQVLANQYGTDQIVVIDPDSGAVEAVIDASSLRPAGVPDDFDHVLNGIAFDPATGHYLLTGKLWPSLFEVRLVPA